MNSVQVSCTPHISPENPFSIPEPRRSIFVQDSDDGNNSSCQKDYHSENTNNHMECKVLVLLILILEKDSFDFILEVYFVFFLQAFKIGVNVVVCFV
mgnify:CR=1 FL=1